MTYMYDIHFHRLQCVFNPVQNLAVMLYVLNFAAKAHCLTADNTRKYLNALLQPAEHIAL